MKKKSKSKRIPPKPDHLIFAGETHIGLVREVNEDCFCYVDYPQESSSLAVVTDGIGGHQSGDIASTLCCRRFVSAWKKKRMGNVSSVEKIKNFLNEQIIEVNNDLFAQNSRKNFDHPMGTTIAAAVFTSENVITAHAGDSRIYEVCDGKIQQLTQDHSFVAELVQKGIISEREAKIHPFSHVISRSVGPTENMQPEINVFKRKPGARFLLCSDGLTIHTSKEQLLEFMSLDSPQNALDKMMKEALIQGGEDNITIICAF
ncbi:protein phosphatase 2C domain-containing protein [Lentisphaerota bacterium ZTH]|nr:serine/threonine-protein phosphatase [Lentisphaerota bacterium]WET06131.1 protein phosphatase 2C domain-containing protein [Lentisphaerota bacterium ZTH]